MDGFLIVCVALFLIGTVLNSLKIYYSFQQRKKCFTNKLLQYTTGSSMLITLFGALGILAAKLSNASMEIGVEIFLMAVCVHNITSQSFFFVSIVLDRLMSLERKVIMKKPTQIGIGIIVLVPIGASGVIGGCGARLGRVVGTQFIPTLVFITVLISLVLLAVFYRRAKRIKMAVFPATADSRLDGMEVGHAVRLTVTVVPCVGDKEVMVGPAAEPIEQVTAFAIGMDSSNNEAERVRFLKSSLKKTDQILGETAKRSVCFFIGKEVERWRREKVLRRIEKEKSVALKCILMYIYYTVCFFPISFLCCYDYEFSLRSIAARLCYALASSFVIVDPTVYIIIVNINSLKQLFANIKNKKVSEK